LHFYFSVAFRYPLSLAGSNIRSEYKNEISAIDDKFRNLRIVANIRKNLKFDEYITLALIYWIISLNIMSSILYNEEYPNLILCCVALRSCDDQSFHQQSSTDNYISPYLISSYIRRIYVVHCAIGKLQLTFVFTYRSKIKKKVKFLARWSMIPPRCPCDILLEYCSLW